MMALVIGLLSGLLICIFSYNISQVRKQQQRLSWLKERLLGLDDTQGSIKGISDLELNRIELQGILQEVWAIQKEHDKNLIVKSRDLLTMTWRRFTFQKRSQTVVSASTERPPRLAEYLLYFLPKAQREPLLGDCEEVYRVLYKDQGKRRAQFWYWCQVVMAFQPLWSNKIVKRLAMWAALSGIGRLLSRVIPWGWVRRYLPLDEWIRHIIS